MQIIAEKKFANVVDMVCLVPYTLVMNKERETKMTTVHSVQKFGTAGYLYRGISIDNRRGIRGGRSYEVNVTKFATDQYRANFYNTILTYKFIADTLSDALANIDSMFDNGDLA